jgi:hypothetical protein
VISHSRPLPRLHFFTWPRCRKRTATRAALLIHTQYSLNHCAQRAASKRIGLRCGCSPNRQRRPNRVSAPDAAGLEGLTHSAAGRAGLRRCNVQSRAAIPTNKPICRGGRLLAALSRQRLSIGMGCAGASIIEILRDTDQLDCLCLTPRLLRQSMPVLGQVLPDHR